METKFVSPWVSYALHPTTPIPPSNAVKECPIPLSTSLSPFFAPIQAPGFLSSSTEEVESLPREMIKSEAAYASNVLLLEHSRLDRRCLDHHHHGRHRFGRGLPDSRFLDSHRLARIVINDSCGRLEECVKNSRRDDAGAKGEIMPMMK